MARRHFLSKMARSFSFSAYGHRSILSTHTKTLQITREPHITHRGDCIVGVKASCGLPDLPLSIKKPLSTETGRGRLLIKVQDQSFTVEGRGARGLTFSHPTDIVVRKSGYTSERTLMVYADKAAADVPSTFVKLLQNPRERITIEISVQG